MTEAAPQTIGGGRIEGGIDAIVLGANVDGLAAAAYLGKAGLKTVLLEGGAEIGGGVRRRELASGVEIVDGEHLLHALDPLAAEELDLYRHGLSYAARRLESQYYFDDRPPMSVNGDWMRVGQQQPDERDIEASERFFRLCFASAAALQPAFAAPGSHRAGDALNAAPEILREDLKRFLIGSARAVMDQSLSDGALKTALLSEACLRSGNGPDEAFSFLSLLRRWSGETAGLQGACGYPAGGAAGLIDALRRAAQSAKVDIRAAAPAQAILIEWDRVAGVELIGGGQVRAPLVIAAQSASRVFLELIGPDHISIEFQHMLEAARPKLASARLHCHAPATALPLDIYDNPRRRFVYAPPLDDLRAAFGAIRRGELSEKFILELIIPSLLEDEDAKDDVTISVMAHPIAMRADYDDDMRARLKEAILSTLSHIMPDLPKAAHAVDLRLPGDGPDNGQAEWAGARVGILQQWALAGRLADAAGIAGLFFCGPEAQIGPGLTCAPGRAAARGAIAFSKRNT